MAECNISRCSHERRIFRKELHKWSKEILYILGLERLAEELMGVRKWKILVQPFTDLENDSPVDWYPEETCYFCCAKKQPLYDPASGIIPNLDTYSSLRVDTDDHSVSSGPLKISGSFISCTSNLSPWSISAITSLSDPNSPLTDQPLDLSISSSKQQIVDTMSSKLLENTHSSQMNVNEESLKSVLKVPQIPLKHGLRKRVDTNSKRSYTEEELQAALRDIQSGKLGTRRAAVIYGIPRSTLRNKVYKLANESKSRAHFASNNSGTSPNSKEQTKCLKWNSEVEVPAFDISQKPNLSSASESLRQLLKHTITQKGHSGRSADKIKEDPFPILSGTVNELEMLGALECSQALGPVLSHVFSDIQNLALSKTKENIDNTDQSLNALTEDMKLPLLPDLIRRLTDEHFDSKRESNNDSNHTQDEFEDMETCSQSNVILKVPSFKPVKSSTNNDVDNPSHPDVSSPPPEPSSHSHSGNKGIAVSLKQLIARSISQKVADHQKDQRSEYPFSISHIDRQANASRIIDHISRDDNESVCNTNNSNSSDSLKSEKRTRPKRGRYRNYDRDNLVRAVRAVQKGEMSVHRAGTFYGVPHSTLEYKVKERHLLRLKKKDSVISSSADTSDLVFVPKGDSLSCDNLKQTKKNISEIDFEMCNDIEQSRRPSVDSYPSSFSLWQSLPFLSLDFSQLGSDNFFASQMMRKLQENARIHEETQKKQKRQDLGILESLIKSTLEKSVLPEHKSTFILSSDSHTPTTLTDFKEVSESDKK